MLVPPDPHHIRHALALVLCTENAPLLTLIVEARLLDAPNMLATLVHHIHHTLKLVFCTERAPPIALKIKMGPLAAPSILALNYKLQEVQNVTGSGSDFY